MSAQKRRRKVSRRTSLRRKRQMTVLFLLAVFLVIFIFAGSYMALRKYVNHADKDVICNNVYIGVLDVSGMTKKEAKSALEKQLETDKNVNLTLTSGKKTAQAALGELGLSIKGEEKLIQNALDYGKDGSVWVRYRQMKELEQKKQVFEETFVLDEKKTKETLNNLESSLVTGAKDASVKLNRGKFEVKAEKDGRKIDVKETQDAVTKHLNRKWDHQEFSVKAATAVDKPKITKNDLETIEDKLGSFSTDAGGGTRWKNLQTGVSKLNGTVLMPGEELSVYHTTAPYDEEHGYVQAGAYENGQVVDAYGGGICQVSTTLYNAVIYAELEILERCPHSMTVAYVDPSRDAAIAGDYMDLRFKNPYKTPIYIYGEIDDNNQLQFAIYGKETRPKNRKIEFESETLSVEEYGVTYQENPKAAFGSMTYTGSPHTGREARLWKVVYEDGREVSRDIFNTSHYEKSNQIVEVGTASGSPEAVKLLQAAIASQDEAKIKEAISQAGAAAGQEKSEEENAEENQQ